MKKGDRVTAELKEYYDGRPVANWPNPQYVGTVKWVRVIAGLTYARVKYDSGRTDFELVSRLSTL